MAANLLNSPGKLATTAQTTSFTRGGLLQDLFIVIKNCVLVDSSDLAVAVLDDAKEGNKFHVSQEKYDFE